MKPVFALVAFVLAVDQDDLRRKKHKHHLHSASLDAAEPPMPNEPYVDPKIKDVPAEAEVKATSRRERQIKQVLADTNALDPDEEDPSAHLFDDNTDPKDDPSSDQYDWSKDPEEKAIMNAKLDDGTDPELNKRDEEDEEKAFKPMDAFEQRMRGLAANAGKHERAFVDRENRLLEKEDREKAGDLTEGESVEKFLDDMNQTITAETKEWKKQHPTWHMRTSADPKDDDTSYSEEASDVDTSALDKDIAEDVEADEEWKTPPPTPTAEETERQERAAAEAMHQAQPSSGTFDDPTDPTNDEEDLHTGIGSRELEAAADAAKVAAGHPGPDKSWRR